MIRRIAAGILALLVLLSASATAEYEQYRLAVPDEKDAVQLWEVFPLDAHNVIVRVYSPEAPWHVDWYRDGEKIRSLTTGGDYDRKTPPEPVIGPEAGKASGLSAAMRAFQFFRIRAFHGGFGPV